MSCIVSYEAHNLIISEIYDEGQDNIKLWAGPMLQVRLVSLGIPTCNLVPTLRKLVYL